ncbi:hypothetical protein GCM10023116_14980 [Kistimonas scapharcae]|uniref:Uncharacterized protein n=1 Tax=Kistimonas scapharcae TaxID=1036133 RepID=A0ABP8UZQ5_9GAMM
MNNILSKICDDVRELNKELLDVIFMEGHSDALLFTGLSAMQYSGLKTLYDAENNVLYENNCLLLKIYLDNMVPLQINSFVKPIHLNTIILLGCRSLLRFDKKVARVVYGVDEATASSIAEMSYSEIKKIAGYSILKPAYRFEYCRKITSDVKVSPLLLNASV